MASPTDPTSRQLEPVNLTLSSQVLAQLRCPKTQQTLHLATEDEVHVWQQLEPETPQFLVTEDGAIAYPVADGYPILLLDRGLKKTSGS